MADHYAEKCSFGEQLQETTDNRLVSVDQQLVREVYAKREAQAHAPLQERESRLSEDRS